MEIWKPTIISPNYEVSNLGRVRSVERRGMDKRGRLTLKRSFILKPQVQSLKDACKSLKISRSTLSRYCINKSTINNLRFEYI